MFDMLNKLRYLLGRREKRQALGLFALMLGGVGLEMLGVGSIPAFVAVLDDPDRLLQYDVIRRVYDTLGIGSHEEFILWSAGALALVYVVKNSYLGFLAYVRTRYVQRRKVSIGHRLFGAYLHSPYTFHLQRNTADLLRNANNEADQAVSMVFMPVLRLTMEGLVLAGLFGLLLWVDPVASVVASVTLGGVCGGFYYLIRRRLSARGKERQHYRGKMIQSVNEGLGGIKTTKLLGREEHFQQSYFRSASRFADASVFASVVGALPRLFVEVAAVLGLLMVAVLFVLQGRALGGIMPALTLFAAASVRLIPSFNRITVSLSQIRFGRSAVDAIWDDLKALGGRPTTNGHAGASEMNFQSAVAARDVHYRYPGAHEEALKGLTFEIPRGRAVAFTGPSGAGKTTTVNALLGLLEPTAGTVQVDGTDIRENTSSWQRKIGYVPQDIFLSDATIRENIAFGLAPDAIDEEAVQEAAASAQLGRLLGRLPEGLDTLVGERGIRLSGGQRQRVGIARALYHDPQVLVMDEATSDLDNETERYIMEAVERLRGDRTLIIIAHRLSTVRGCDRLFFLKEGRLEASGTYDELLETSDGFRTMVPA